MELNIGPVLFNWQAEMWRDFYFMLADEAPIDKVFLGEVICAKRAPLFYPYFDDVIKRLERAKKQIIFSTLAEISSDTDRRLLKKQASQKDFIIEANDIAALAHIGKREHYIGAYINCYNEMALEFFAQNGAKNICLNAEISKETIMELAKKAKEFDVKIEVQIFGRMGLALSARCYHARAYNRTKDSCKYICEVDRDGMELATLEGDKFLAINGIQTMSYSYLNLLNEIEELKEIGVSNFRISPHSHSTLEVTKIFRAVLDEKMDKEEASFKLRELYPNVSFCNGFYHSIRGCEWQN